MSLRNVAIFVAGLLGLLACGWAFQRDTARTGTLAGSLEVGGRSRTYLVHVPPAGVANTPLPLVFVLHGGTGNAQSAEKMSGMSAKADRERFLAVYPTGTGALPTWNAGNCCGYALGKHVDDIGFFRALIEKLKRGYSIDPKRIYFTGMSNGAMMSYRVACEMADQVAAIAPVEGALNVDCRPSAPVSVLIFHGTADSQVPFNGGSSPFQLVKRTDNSVANAVAFWLKRDACPAVPKHDETAEAWSDTYSGCQDGAGVTLYAIPGGRHVWPGLARSGNRVPATDLIWSFFAAHPKP